MAADNTHHTPALRWRSDLAVIVGLAALCYGLASVLDLHEAFVRWIAHYERWDLDELLFSALVLLGVTTSAALAHLAIRHGVISSAGA